MADKKRVLLVDDDPVVCLLIKKLAERHGAKTTIAHDGRQAQALLQEPDQFDIVFLDLLMPHLTGWDVLNSIKDNPKTAHIPVVIVTAAPISTKEMKKLWKKTAAVVDKETFSIAQFERLLDKLLGPA